MRNITTRFKPFSDYYSLYCPLTLTFDLIPYINNNVSIRTPGILLTIITTPYLTARFNFANQFISSIFSTQCKLTFRCFNDVSIEIIVVTT